MDVGGRCTETDKHLKSILEMVPCIELDRWKRRDGCDCKHSLEGMLGVHGGHHMKEDTWETAKYVVLKYTNTTLETEPLGYLEEASTVHFESSRLGKFH